MEEDGEIVDEWKLKYADTKILLYAVSRREASSAFFVTGTW